MRRMLHKAKDWKKIQEVPERINLAYAPARNMLVTPDTEMRILARAPQPLYDFFVMLVDLGMRPGEVISMEVQYVDAAKAYYRNPKGKTRTARRVIPLSDRVLAILKVRDGDRRMGWVFPSGKSKSGHIELHKLQLRFRKICRELELPDELVMYCGRHTYGTGVIEETGDPYLVSSTMGHADLRATRPYMHPQLNRAKEAIDRRNAAKLPRPVTQAVM
jgi:integrase